MFSLNITIPTLGYFDLEVFDLYLFADLENYYVDLDKNVSYLLACLHSIVLFLSYNGKKYL